MVSCDLAFRWTAPAIPDSSLSGKILVGRPRQRVTICASRSPHCTFVMLLVAATCRLAPSRIIRDPQSSCSDIIPRAEQYCVNDCSCNVTICLGAGPGGPNPRGGRLHRRCDHRVLRWMLLWLLRTPRHHRRVGSPATHNRGCSAGRPSPVVL
jgi:hypothetical protein